MNENKVQNFFLLFLLFSAPSFEKAKGGVFITRECEYRGFPFFKGRFSVFRRGNLFRGYNSKKEVPRKKMASLFHLERLA